MLIHRSSDGSPPATGRAAPDIASTAELQAWVETMASPRHFYYESNANRRIALWLADQFREWNYEVAFHGQTRNVVAAPPGLEGPVMLVGAHYDSAPRCPGADDNASAVAAMLSAARWRSATKPNSRVVFVAFNREEDGLLGSAEFVHETLCTLPWQVTGAHILEMVGYTSHEPGSQKVPDGLPIKLPSTADFLGLLANGISAALMKEIIVRSRETFPDFQALGLEVRLGMERLLPVLRRSDHVPFWEKRIPAVMWTDTSEFRNPHYHQPTDTPDTLDFEFLRRVAQLVTVSLPNE